MRVKYKLILFLLFLILFIAFWVSKPFTQSQNLDVPRKVYTKIYKGHFQLFKNNKPFYIRGAAGQPLFKDLVTMGGNTLRLYDTIHLKSNLIEAEKKGIAIILDLPIPRNSSSYDPYAKASDNIRLKKEIQSIVKKYKGYPALLLWNLGNEVEYPFVIKKNNFINTFNDLIDIIHTEDPDHPVSTSIISGSTRQTLSLFWHSPKLDIIAFNIFGDLQNLQSKLDKISIITAREIPYYISEWGANGTWEEERTIWDAPIEPTSTKKGEQCKQIYEAHIAFKKSCLGSLVFYWGQKQERTQTWFNIFDKKYRKSQTYYELRSIWKDSTLDKIVPPQIKYMLVDDKGARDQLIFSPNEIKTAKLFFSTPIDSSLVFKWEIRPEAWYYRRWEQEQNPNKIEGALMKIQENETTFKVPREEGPYRIYAYVYDQKGNFASANTPFYVLKSPDEK